MRRVMELANTRIKNLLSNLYALENRTSFGVKVEANSRTGIKRRLGREFNRERRRPS